LKKATKELPKVLIVGAGGVGGYIGARLLQSGKTDVDMLARGDHMRAISKNGLLIHESDGSSFRVNPGLYDKKSNEGKIYDLVIVTVKYGDLEESLKYILNNISNSTIILPLLNGIAHTRLIDSIVERGRKLNGCIYIVSNIEEPGAIRKKGKVFKICWGISGMNMDKYKILSKLFDSAGLRHKATDDIEREMWKKYLFISPMALLSSYYETDMYGVYNYHRSELETLMKELLALGQALDIAIYEDDILSNIEQASKVPPGSRTSLQLDIEKSKNSELYPLGGYIVEEATKRGVDVNLTNKIYTYLLEKTKSNQRAHSSS